MPNKHLKTLETTLKSVRTLFQTFKLRLMTCKTNQAVLMMIWRLKSAWMSGSSITKYLIRTKTATSRMIGRSMATATITSFTGAAVARSQSNWPSKRDQVFGRGSIYPEEKKRTRLGTDWCTKNSILKKAVQTGWGSAYRVRDLWNTKVLKLEIEISN